MLVDIMSGKLPSRCILIQDSVEQSGHTLWQAFLQHAVDENKNVHIFCFETPAVELQKNINGSHNRKIQLYDIFSDHRNWHQCCNRRTGDTETVEIGPKCLERAVNSHLFESDSRVVFIDSLCPLISSTDACNCYGQLHTLCNAGQVVCLVHEDVLLNAQATLDILYHLATTCLLVSSPSATSQGRPIVEIRHLKPGGGVIRQTEKFTIGVDKKVISEKVLGSVNTLGMNSKQQDSCQLPSDLTTFKIDLEQNEKQARSKLVLPYIRPSVDLAVQSESRVFYQPDAGDDWDEEDPDDDLDV